MCLQYRCDSDVITGEGSTKAADVLDPLAQILMSWFCPNPVSSNPSSGTVQSWIQSYSGTTTFTLPL